MGNALPAALGELIAVRVAAARTATVCLAEATGLGKLFTTDELAPGTVGIATIAWCRHDGKCGAPVMIDDTE